MGEELTTNAVPVASDREIVRFLAVEVMGWKLRALALTSGVFDEPEPSVITHIWPRNWTPLESIADAFEVQSALPEGKQVEFAERLRSIVFCTSETDMEIPWLLANATPRQRSIAAYRAMGGEE